MSRIGIYGGTFNPIHNTHINIARAAKIQFELDRVYFLVAGEPPHKEIWDTTTAFQRLEMVRLAIASEPGFEIDSREVYRTGKSYSYITLEEYKAQFPEDDLFFIMGSDSLKNFENWVKPESISECATILYAPRFGDDMTLLSNIREAYNKKFPGEFKTINFIPNSYSSTEIRNNISMEDAISEFVPEVVETYINRHGIYKDCYDNSKVLELSKAMKDELKSGRFIHTIGVANTAYTLALKWDYPAYNAMVAGMLHDCAKCISDDKRINICKENGIPITDIEKKYPHLLHGKAGAYLAMKKYGIKNTDILHSIQVHTTGCVNMSLLDEIIFVADYIEPGRTKQPRLDLLRKIAYEDLELCVYMILEDTVNYLDENPEQTDPTTVDTYNYYKEKRGN